MYKNFLRPLLFLLEPETAHDLTINLAKVFQKFDFLTGRAGSVFSGPDAPVEVMGLKFRNPVGLAAGFDKNCEIYRFLSKLGFGFLELGTVTLHAQAGNPRPRLFRIQESSAIINRMGLNNAGAAEAAKNLERIGKTEIPLGISIGKNTDCSLEKAPENYLETLKILYPHGDYFVLNISCPNVPDAGRLCRPGYVLSVLEPVMEFMESMGRKPLFIKIPCDLTGRETAGMANIAVEYGTGLAASNTANSREGVPEKWKTEKGGLSGAPLEEISNKIISGIRAVSKTVPVIGTGGVTSPESALKKLKLGANLVEVYTGMIYNGPFFVKEILKYIALEGK
ncbi:MAG: quinone-dependent dihydroorotate dehydrogenase [Elusimicrobia bacterium]|nr:quinone-dependent dihydroorotate dehydrogenase [Elusimicrobiota bacterium]